MGCAWLKQKLKQSFLFTESSQRSQLSGLKHADKGAMSDAWNQNSKQIQSHCFQQWCMSLYALGSDSSWWKFMMLFAVVWIIYDAPSARIEWVGLVTPKCWPSTPYMCDWELWSCVCCRVRFRESIRFSHVTSWDGDSSDFNPLILG